MLVDFEKKKKYHMKKLLQCGSLDMFVCGLDREVEIASGTVSMCINLKGAM